MRSFTRTIIEARTQELGQEARVIMRSMPTALKTLVILLLVALIPLRAMAAVTVGFCAAGHGDPNVATHGGPGHAGAHEHHGDDKSPVKSSAHTCNSCVEHCSGAAFAASADPTPSSPAIVQGRIDFVGRPAPASFTDQLDRPPLV